MIMDAAAEVVEEDEEDHKRCGPCVGGTAQYWAVTNNFM